MGTATSLSKFIPKSEKDKKPHKVLIGGRYHYKGKLMGNPRFKRGAPSQGGARTVPGENAAQRRKRRYVPTGRKPGNPNVKKGMERTPGCGRKKGTTNKYRITDLVKAIQEVEEEENITLLKHFIKRALKSDPSMNNLMKKLLPDLKAVEAKVEQEAPFRLIVEMEGT